MEVLSGVRHLRIKVLMSLLIAAVLSFVGAVGVLISPLPPSEFVVNTLQIFSPKGFVITLYLFSLLLFCVYLLGTTSLLEKTEETSKISRWYWRTLAVIFLFFSIDVVTEIHHKLGAVVTGELRLEGWLWYSWVIVYAPFLLIFGLCYLKFLLRLPSGTRNLFIFSGIITLLGAFVFEIILGKLNHLYGIENVISQLFGVFKKSCEMFGVIIFAYALLLYIKEQNKIDE